MNDKKPQPAKPQLWSPDHKWADNFPLLEVLWDEANSAACAVRGVGFQPVVDELAILMPGREVLMAFVEEAVQHGWVYFNSSVDTVRTEPMGTVFGVQYHFLRHPEKPWRLELMVKTWGISPLHDTLADLAEDRGFPVVHASFKPADGESLSRFVREENALEAEGYLMAQECVSAYGRFGYWRKPGIEYAFFLKPRINLRDAMPSQGSLRDVEVRR